MKQNKMINVDKLNSAIRKIELMSSCNDNLCDQYELCRICVAERLFADIKLSMDETDNESTQKKAKHKSKKKGN